jgi:hypothetical protein
LPYGNPAGIDPGPAAQPPVKKDDSKTPAVPTTDPTWWDKWKTTIGVSAVGIAAIGGIMYFGMSKKGPGGQISK